MLNPHTFPIVPYPGRAPEAAPLSGMGGWDAYAQLAPADRFLPFVLSRALAPSNSYWLNCAKVIREDTGATVVTLEPTGAGQPAVDYGLVLTKYVDAAAGVEHFAYLGAAVQNIDLPCGVPLRLILDNAWQSPLFLPRWDLATTTMVLEWWHPGPLAGVPYGGGLRQRFYVEAGALQFAAAREEKETSKEPATGGLRIDFLAKWRTAGLMVAPVPAYLAEAFDAAPAHQHFTAAGEAWRLVDVKPRDAGQDGGRWGLELTVEQQQVLVARSCVATPLAAVAFSPDLPPRGWRCGDTADTEPDIVRTSGYACVLDSDGLNTGEVTYTLTDINPYSATYEDGNVVTEANEALCPPPVTYYSVEVTGNAFRNNCPAGQQGSAVVFTVDAGAYTSLVSQADANAQAQAYFNANAQANANATGTCAIPTETWNPVYEAGGCFACQMVNAADPLDVRDACVDEVDLYFRNTDNVGAGCAACLHAPPCLY